MNDQTITKEKARLRAMIREQMQALTKQERGESDTRLFARFLALGELAQANSVLLFHGVGAEPETNQLLSILQAAGKRVALPRCLPGRQMEARLVTGAESLQRSAFGIPEPTEALPLIQKQDIDLILVPALCCDRFGFRLGQGGGYYDRYLADYAGLTVTLCRAAFLQDALPHESFDQPVAQVLTEWERLSPARAV